MAAALASAMLVGLVQTTFGPAFSAFSRRFGVPIDEVGFIVGAFFAGTLLTTWLAGRRLKAVGFSAALPAGPALLGLGALTLAAAPVWGVALFGAFVTGAGFGWVNTTILVLLGAAYPTRRLAAFNLESAFFGLGSMVGPWLVGILLGFGLPALYATIAALAFLVAALVLGVPGVPAVPGEKARAGGADVRLFAFMAFFFVYVGLESSGGHWGAYHLETLGWTSVVWIGLYWGMQTAGRLTVAAFAPGLRAERFLFVALTLVALTYVLVASGPWAGYAYPAAGFFLGPVFPAAMSWVQQVLGPGGRATSWVLLAGGVGGVFPSLIGVAVGRFGPGAIPFILGAIALVLAFYALVLEGWLRKKHRSAG